MEATELSLQSFNQFRLTKSRIVASIPLSSAYVALQGTVAGCLAELARHYYCPTGRGKEGVAGGGPHEEVWSRCTKRLLIVYYDHHQHHHRDGSNDESKQRKGSPRTTVSPSSTPLSVATLGAKLSTFFRGESIEMAGALGQVKPLKASLFRKVSVQTLVRDPKFLYAAVKQNQLDLVSCLLLLFRGGPPTRNSASAYITADLQGGSSSPQEQTTTTSSTTVIVSDALLQEVIDLGHLRMARILTSVAEATAPAATSTSSNSCFAPLADREVLVSAFHRLISSSASVHQNTCSPADQEAVQETLQGRGSITTTICAADDCSSSQRGGLLLLQVNRFISEAGVSPCEFSTRSGLTALHVAASAATAGSPIRGESVASTTIMSLLLKRCKLEENAAEKENAEEKEKVEEKEKHQAPLPYPSHAPHHRHRLLTRWPAPKGRAPIHLAVNSGHVEATRLLLEDGALRQQREESGTMVVAPMIVDPGLFIEDVLDFASEHDGLEELARFVIETSEAGSRII